MTTEINRELQKLITNGQVEIDQNELLSNEKTSKRPISNKIHLWIRAACLAGAMLSPAFTCNNDPGMIGAEQHMTQNAIDNPGLPLDLQQKTLDAQNGITKTAPTLTPEVTAEPEAITEKYTVENGDTLIDLYLEFLDDENLSWDNSDRVIVYDQYENAKGSYIVEELRNSELILNIGDIVVFEAR